MASNELDRLKSFILNKLEDISDLKMQKHSSRSFLKVDHVSWLMNLSTILLMCNNCAIHVPSLYNFHIATTVMYFIRTVWLTSFVVTYVIEALFDQRLSLLRTRVTDMSLPRHLFRGIWSFTVSLALENVGLLGLSKRDDHAKHPTRTIEFCQNAQSRKFDRDSSRAKIINKLDSKFSVKYFIVSAILILLLYPIPSSAAISGQNSSAVQNFTIGVFFPKTGAQRAGPEAEAAVNWTVQKLNAQFDGRFHFQYLIRDTRCDKDVALATFVDMLCEKTKGISGIHAVVGPACDDVCQVVGGLAGNRGIPVISNGCASPSLSDRLLYPTFLRTSSTFADMEQFLQVGLPLFGWQRVTVVHGNGTVWLDASDEFVDTLKHSGFHVRQMSIRHPETLEEDLKNESDYTRVFLLCAYDQDIVRFMEMADRLGMNTGLYAYITINLANNAKVHSNWTHLPVLDGLLDITLDVSPDSSTYQDFIAEILATSPIPHNAHMASCPTNYELAIQSALMSDAITLYATAVNATISGNGDPSDGASLAYHLYGVSIAGVTGNVTIDSRGQRLAQFMMHNIQNGCYVPVATYHVNYGVTFLNNTIVWPGGSLMIPADGPECGWDGELCVNSDAKTYISIGATSIFVLLIGICVIFFMSKYIRKRENAMKLQSNDWKINLRDLKKPRHEEEPHTDSGRFNNHGDMHCGSTVSIESTDSLRSTVQRTQGLYYYHGQVVMVKHINKPFGVAHTASLSKELNQIRQLDNRNINPFLGACTEREHVCVVSLYCRKGSLYDVLHTSDLTFDCRFVATLSTDISKGLQYLHNTEVGYHGRLKSRNVFVDSTFTCRIGDIHMPYFREGELLDRTSEYYKTRQLWSAPEVVSGQIYRQETEENKMALWQRADMWSFGVILHEIINRKKPFHTLYDTAPARAVERLKNGSRPDEGSGDVDRLLEVRRRQGHLSTNDQYMMKVIDMLGLCWQRFPELRITSADVAKRLRDYGKEHQLLSSNFYENLMHMMTKNEEELGRQVQLRTAELETEKNTTKRLLNQMLPTSVAEQLLRGDPPLAESYDCVTVFFSDIVHFTQLSANCSPMEVMDIVNALYIYFDGVIESFNVYKVETIGDAYMVASGLPMRNGDEHAGAIAEMALALLGGLGTMTVPHRPRYRLQIRAGIHSGPVVAGVVGKKMPRYCLFGDTVNTASRMESHGKPLKIQISQDTKTLLEKTGGFHIKKRSEPLIVKGKGKMLTFWLTGKDQSPWKLQEADSPSPPPQEEDMDGSLIEQAPKTSVRDIPQIREELWTSEIDALLDNTDKADEKLFVNKSPIHVIDKTQKRDLTSIDATKLGSNAHLKDTHESSIDFFSEYDWVRGKGISVIDTRKPSKKVLSLPDTRSLDGRYLCPTPKESHRENPKTAHRERAHSVSTSKVWRQKRSDKRGQGVSNGSVEHV